MTFKVDIQSSKLVGQQQRIAEPNLSEFENGEADVVQRQYEKSLRTPPSYTIVPEEWKGIESCSENDFELIYQCRNSDSGGQPYWQNVSKQFYDTDIDEYRRIIARPKAKQEKGNRGIEDFAETLHKQGVRVIFGLQPEHFPIIEKWIAKFGGNIYSDYAWREIGREIHWDALTAMCFYLQSLNHSTFKKQL